MLHAPHPPAPSPAATPTVRSLRSLPPCAQAELAEAEAEVAAPDDEEEDDFVYNPLKLPLGWDGKPIPYWLYKLHGLNQEFKCEICGNQSYWGRRAYEKHFKEYKHQQGMRSLGIPNNKMFYEVTKIEDALQLWKSIQVRRIGRAGRGVEGRGGGTGLCARMGALGDLNRWPPSTQNYRLTPSRMDTSPRIPILSRHAYNPHATLPLPL